MRNGVQREDGEVEVTESKVQRWSIDNDEGNMIVD